MLKLREIYNVNKRIQSMEIVESFQTLEVNSQNRDIDFEDIEERPLKKGEKAKLLVERSLELISM